MLKQHTPRIVVGEQPGGAEGAPVPLPRRCDDPRVARVARTVGASTLVEGGGLDRHRFSLSHSAGGYRWRFSRTRMLSTIGVPSKP